MLTSTMRGLLISTVLIFGVPALAQDTATTTQEMQEVMPGTMGETAMGSALLTPLGMALYTLETDSRGTSTCNDDCAKTWVPLPVEQGAVPTGDWGVVVREDGTRMWSYKDQPVYTYVEDKAAGEVTGDSKGGFYLAGLSGADRAAFVAATIPVAMMGVTSKGPAWVESHGMALYTYDQDTEGKSNCNGDCAVNWPPLMVEDGAVESEHWTIVVREDGTKMWALKGKPLYMFVQDKVPGEVNGDNVNGFHLAM